jgi:hypothetical protein
MTLWKLVSVSAGALLLLLSIAAGAAASTPAPGIPYPPCFGGTTLHAQIAGHIAYECLGAGGDTSTTDLGTGVYWSDNLYDLNYNWHPGSGEIVVEEIFLKSCAEVSLERHGAPCALYGGVPVTDTNPGADSYANGRLIWMADGCLVDAPTDTTSPPTDCSAVILDGGRSAAVGRPMTPVELDSIADYWAIMEKYIPDQYW